MKNNLETKNISKRCFGKDIVFIKIIDFYEIDFIASVFSLWLVSDNAFPLYDSMQISSKKKMVRNSFISRIETSNKMKNNNQR